MKTIEKLAALYVDDKQQHSFRDSRPSLGSFAPLDSHLRQAQSGLIAVFLRTNI
jgi:hypothetical protein